MSIDQATLKRLEETILQLVASCGIDKTICPSQAARMAGGDHPDHWGPLMHPVRRVAITLMREGKVAIYRKGRLVDPDDFKGVYRIGSARLD
jgi:hypothetical protein